MASVSMRPDTPIPRTWVLLVALTGLLSSAGAAVGQICTYNPIQPNLASFGTIDPASVVTKTFSITLSYTCIGGANASFTITGVNDTGPGAYRLRNVTQLTQYMNYTITTVNVAGTKITLNGQLVAADYQNAYVGNYTDILTVLVLP